MITLKTFSSFSREPLSTKRIKYTQLRCNFEDKMDKQKGLLSIIIDYNGFLCKLMK